MKKLKIEIEENVPWHHRNVKNNLKKINSFVFGEFAGKILPCQNVYFFNSLGTGIFDISCFNFKHS